MKFIIDSFYNDDNYGVVKFKGYLNGNLLFDRFEKSFIEKGEGSGWHPTGQRVNIKEDFQLKRLAAGKIKPILSPQ